MGVQVIARTCVVTLMLCLTTGCEVLIVGAGRSATAEDTGFMKSYQRLTSAKDPAYPNLPDLSYVSPESNANTYSKILMPDFTSLTSDVNMLGGLQVRQYKTIKQELPDQIANTFDGSVFNRVTRTSERIDPRDIAAIRRLPADAVLLGNIKELVAAGGEKSAGLTAIQVEYKLVDVRTGEEVAAAIHRSTTDLDKVAMMQVYALTALLNKAKGGRSIVTGSGSAPSAQVNQQPSRPSASTAISDGGLRTSKSAATDMASSQTMSPKEAQERLLALGYSPGTPDGVLGRNTVNALKKFQQANGIPVTGKIDQQTS